MPTRTILTVPNPILREKAKRVKTITPEIQRLIKDMIDTMRVAPGVGLAAPQIGVSLRIVVVEYGEPSEDPEAEPKPKKLYALVNPEIIRYNEEKVFGTEGCLSVPDYMGNVERFTQVTVRGLDRRGRPFRLKARGWLARIFQHEIDHLNGVLFLDLASKLYNVKEQVHQESSQTV